MKTSLMQGFNAGRHQKGLKHQNGILGMQAHNELPFIQWIDEYVHLVLNAQQQKGETSMLIASEKDRIIP